ncbi:MAG TPA: class II fructose-bisphosphate aldolase [Candidatus Paceibacterota bacterium]|nr:class II fructose-bisphosphate aldolase [Candidatus Paceibacterota bacterium]
MKTLREVIAQYAHEKKALGHFNFSDSNQLAAIANAAMECKLPVAVGLSEGEREFFPLAEARALVDYYNAHGAEIYLNADHTYSIEKVQAALADGVDSVVVDGAQLSFAENVLLLQTAVKYAKAAGGDVLVEGELGYIGTGSDVHDILPEGAAVTEEMMTKPDELVKFVQETGADLMAPAVGNIHGLVQSGQPKLSIERIGALAAVSPVPLVLHGGSGSSDDEFRQAIAAGVVMIHINTDLRVIYKESLEKALTSTHEVAPYKFLTPAVDAMQAYVAQKLRLFANA